MPLIATKTTRVTLDAARDISLGSIRVHSILVSNDSVGDVTVEFTDADDVALLSMSVLAQSSLTWDPIWMADNGLKVLTASSAAVTVTVAHTADGA